MVNEKDNMEEYRDYSGNKVYPRFYMGGISDDILVCGLYTQRKYIPNWFPKSIKFKEVFWRVSTQSPHLVNKWVKRDFHNFILETITKYSDSKKVLNEKLKVMNNEFNK
jgi:hypothetical protein